MLHQLKRFVLLSVLITSISVSAHAQNHHYGNTDGLYKLAKVWGFVKYFHPVITEHKIDWDDELIAFLPGYAAATSSQEQNDSMLAWINRLGDIPTKSAPGYESLVNPKLVPDFAWLSSRHLGEALNSKLQDVLSNRQQGDQRFIKFMRTEGLNIPIFQNEKRFPASEWNRTEVRLLALFRFWNAMEYWYPYKYNLPIAWDDVLKQSIPKFRDANSPEAFNIAIMQLVTALQDGHGFVMSAVTNKMMGSYYMPVRFRYVEGNVIIASIRNDSAARVAGLNVGDVVETIDNKPVNIIIEELSPITPASNEPYRLFSICVNLNRTTTANTRLQLRRGKKNITTIVANELIKTRVDQYVPSFTHQRDSSLAMLTGNIAYLNMGKLTMGDDSVTVVKILEQSSALIIDARQNAIEDPKRPNVIGLLEEWVCNGTQPYVFSTGQPEHAGAFRLVTDGPPPFQPHPAKYNKPVVILINEEAISVGEFMSMLFSKAPGAVLMGSATAGADGPSSYFQLPGDVYAGFTGTGIYWRDGSETQRVGIQPDIKVTPTIRGYRENKDELLDRAVKYLTRKIK